MVMITDFEVIDVFICTQIFTAEKFIKKSEFQFPYLIKVPYFSLVTI